MLENSDCDIRCMPFCFLKLGTEMECMDWWKCLAEVEEDGTEEEEGF